MASMQHCLAQHGRPLLDLQPATSPSSFSTPMSSSLKLLLQPVDPPAIEMALLFVIQKKGGKVEGRG